MWSTHCVVDSSNLIAHPHPSFPPIIISQVTCVATHVVLQKNPPVGGTTYMAEKSEPKSLGNK